MVLSLYKKSSEKSHKYGIFTTFYMLVNHPIGLHMNPENRWVKMADAIPWEIFEKKYSRLFKGKNGRIAKPLRLALGSLIIQTKYQYSDRELVDQLTENPYYQYFIGLPGYQEEPPIDASTLVLFLKRLKMDVIMEANEYMLEGFKEKESKDKNDDDYTNPPSGGGDGESKTEPEQAPENKGTLMLDATCAPSNIRYAYNESAVLVEAVERFRERTGHYPERLLADQIYRTRDNRNFCKLHGIRLSGPKLGRPSLTKQSSKEKKQEYQDNTDRIEVEHSFSLSKRCYGMDLIRTKLYDTTLTSIALSVFVTNLFKIQS